MIIFNNNELTELLPVKVEDIMVSPIQLNPVARQRAINWGADFVRMGGGTRKVTITFALLERDINERENSMQVLRDWAQIGKEGVLKLPQFDNKFLSCACTQLPDHSYRKWWENKLRLEFTCFDNPYWTSDELSEVACGTAFSLAGSAPPLMTIERKGNAQNNVIYATDKASMTFSKVPAGTLVIDLNRQTAAVGDVSIMGSYVPTSTWIVPDNKITRITGTGSIKFRERWV